MSVKTDLKYIKDVFNGIEEPDIDKVNACLSTIEQCVNDKTKRATTSIVDEASVKKAFVKNMEREYLNHKRKYIFTETFLEKIKKEI